MSKDLLYIKANADVPRGVVSSSARKGMKWYNNTYVGDVLNLKVTETGEVFGRAVVVAREYIRYDDVLDNASSNHVGVLAKQRGDNTPARFLLASTLEAAYGKSEPQNCFTVLHILPLNETAEPVLSEEAQAARETIQELQAVGIAGQLLNKDPNKYAYVRAIEVADEIGDIVRSVRVEF